VLTWSFIEIDRKPAHCRSRSGSRKRSGLLKGFLAADPLWSEAATRNIPPNGKSAKAGHLQTATHSSCISERGNCASTTA
jgi:hypothetical protein